jgi:hypothetical protein
MSPQCTTDELRFKFHELDELNRALGVLRKYGMGPLDDAYKQLFSVRGKLMAQLGLKVPKVTTLLKLLAGLSPGTIKLWHDGDYGWFTEAVERPGAPPAYKKVTDEVAMTILKGEVTHELEITLMTPDDYQGE